AGRGEVVAARQREIHLGPERVRGRGRLVHVDRVGGRVLAQQREHLVRVHEAVAGAGDREVGQRWQRGPVEGGHGGDELGQRRLPVDDDGGAELGQRRLHVDDDAVADRRAGGLAGIGGQLDQPGPFGEVVARLVLVV